MKISIVSAATVALSITLAATVAPYANAGEERITIRQATVPFQTPDRHLDGIAPRSADGTTWAPGGAGATNSISVEGDDLNVRTATVAYFPGTNFVSDNACADEFEIAYYDNGTRVAETSGSNCAVGRVTHTFVLNKDMDANTPFCGRARIGDTWGNYACIQILP